MENQWRNGQRASTGFHCGAIFAFDHNVRAPIAVRLDLMVVAFSIHRSGIRN